jgi:regulator of sigma E protease
LLSGLGFEFWVPALPAVLGKVDPAGVAGKAGLQTGDEITAVNGDAVADFAALRTAIASRPGQEVLLTYRRAGAEQSVRLTVSSAQVEGATIGRLQVEAPRSIRYPDSMLRHSSPGPLAALSRGTTEAWDMMALQARIFWRMLMGQVSLKNLSGPLTIAEFAGDSANAGITSFAGFLVMISLSLGFLNLLPIPILDGGQIVYQVVEWVKGSPLSDRAQVLGQQLGIALLVLMMSVALFYDIARQFG